MSDFDDHLKKADAHLFTLQGDQVSYTPDGGSPAEITAIVGDVSGDNEPDEIGDRVVFESTLLVQRSDIANPLPDGDTVSIGGVTWQVTAILEQDAAATNLQIKRDDDKSRHTETHKKREL